MRDFLKKTIFLILMMAEVLASVSNAATQTVPDSSAFGFAMGNSITNFQMGQVTNTCNPLNNIVSLIGTIGQQMNNNLMSQDLQGASSNAREKALMNSFDQIVGRCPQLIAPSLDMQCQGAVSIPMDINSLSCTMMSPAQMKATKNLFQNAECTSLCKETKISIASNQLLCIQSELDNITTSIQAKQNDFNNAIQFQNKVVNQYATNIADETSKNEFVIGKLKGKNGEKGLLVQQAILNDALVGNAGKAGLNTQVSEFQTQYAQLQQAQGSLDALVRVHSISKCVEDTLNTPMSGYHCTSTGPAVSLKEYILCRYNQDSMLDSNGRINDSSSMRGQSQAKNQNLQAVFDQLQTAMSSASVTAIPMPTGDPKKDAEILANQASMKVLIQSPQDLKNNFQSRFQSFTVNGKNVWNDILAKFFDPNYSGLCGQAYQEVQRELYTPGSAIYQNQLQIQSQQRFLQQGLQSTIQADKQLIQDAYSTLGIVSSISSTACDTQDIQVEIGCIENIKSTVSALLNGANGQAIVIPIMGSNSTDNLNCGSINQCVTVLQNAQKEYEQIIKKDTLSKENFVKNANQEVQMQMNQIAEMFKPQNMLLQTQSQQLRSQLAQMGININASTSSVTKEELVKDPDTGLYKVPTNIASLVGGMMSPPLINSNSLGPIGNDIATQKGTVDGQLAQNQLALSQLQGIEQSCRAQDNDLAIQNISNQLAQATYCYNSHYCGGGQQRTMSVVDEILTNLHVIPVSQRASLASLSTGLMTICDKAVSEPLPPIPNRTVEESTKEWESWNDYNAGKKTKSIKNAPIQPTKSLEETKREWAEYTEMKREVDMRNGIMQSNVMQSQNACNRASASINSLKGMIQDARSSNQRGASSAMTDPMGF